MVWWFNMLQSWADPSLGPRWSTLDMVFGKYFLSNFSLSPNYKHYIWFDSPILHWWKTYIETLPSYLGYTISFQFSDLPISVFLKKIQIYTRPTIIWSSDKKTFLLNEMFIKFWDRHFGYSWPRSYRDKKLRLKLNLVRSRSYSFRLLGMAWLRMGNMIDLAPNPKMGKWVLTWIRNPTNIVLIQIRNLLVFHNTLHNIHFTWSQWCLLDLVHMRCLQNSRHNWGHVIASWLLFFFSSLYFFLVKYYLFQWDLA